MSESTDPLVDQVRRLPISSVAARAKISRDTIYRLLAGEDVKDATRQAVEQAVRDLTESGTAPAPVAPPNAPLHEPSFWQGRMTTVLEMIEAAGRDVRGLLESGVLLRSGSAPPPATQPEPGTTGREMTPEEFEAEMERRGYGTPRPPRRAAR